MNFGIATVCSATAYVASLFFVVAALGDLAFVCLACLKGGRWCSSYTGLGGVIEVLLIDCMWWKPGVVMFGYLLHSNFTWGERQRGSGKQGRYGFFFWVGWCKIVGSMHFG